jgi:hypothetical protein
MQLREPEKTGVREPILPINPQQNLERLRESEVDSRQSPHRHEGKNQKPSALWRSQFNRGKRARHSTVKLRRQYRIPGHQITAPVRASNVSPRAAKPFTARPIGPATRFS